MNRAREPQEGRRVGPYRLGKSVGRGGMGEVYRAFDERLERWVALKRIRSDLAPSDERRQRFRREAKAAAALEHPSIVGVYDLVETSDGDWMVMEWVEGQLLTEWVRQGPLPLPEALALGRQIADALAAAHRRGILHRDLKAENVLITPDGRARIFDFGLAKRLGEADGEALTTDGAVLGTYRTMSPEQSRGMPVTESSDLFALGVLLYEMLTGVSPFLGADAVDTLDRVRRHHPPPLAEHVPGVPAEVASLVDRLLDKDPARRPVSAAAVAVTLRLATAGSTGSESAPSTAATVTAAPVGFAGEQQPTVPVPTVDFASGLPRGTEPAANGAMHPRRLRRARWWLVAAGLVTAVAASWWLARPAGDPLTEPPATPLYVAVAEPVVQLPDEADGDWRLLAPALRGAVLDGLLMLDGVAPLLDDRRGGDPADAAALARALAAEEVLRSRLDCAGQLCRASLHRLSGVDGRVLWSEDFDVPVTDRALLASAVIGHLRHGFPDHPPRTGIRQRPLEGELYDRLLQLSRAHIERSTPGRRLISELEKLRAQAPAAPEVYLLEGEVAYDLYYYSKRKEDLELMLERLQQAQQLAPSDPQALLRLSRVALEAGRIEEARRAIEQLEELIPGDTRIDLRRALLLELQGAGEQAMALMRSAVEHHPSWKALYELAMLCYKHGDVKCSRDSLERLLQRLPESVAARSFLAQLELTSGEPQRAEEFYLELTATSPGVAELCNLGLARMLLGRFAEAAASFEQALALEPGNPFTLLNLADAEHLRGRTEIARKLYRRVLETTAARDDAGDWQRLTVRAQALAHLDRQREAVGELQAALRIAGEHPQAAFEAALVFAVLGEPISAEVHAEHALGVFGRRWFELPWFDELRRDPSFRQLLEST
jgi:serine/threonine-protein kinase